MSVQLSTPYNANQMEVLSAIVDAIFHECDENELLSVAPESFTSEQREHVRFLARAKYSALPGAVPALAHQFAISLSKINVDSIGLVLTLLSTRAGTLVLTGHTGFFVNLSVEQREQILKNWGSSSLALMRRVYRGFVSVALYVAYTNFDQIALATGFPALGEANRFADKNRLRNHYAFVFENISVPYQYIDTDILVVGSGAGGGVVSSELAKKGWKVLVVEKGPYVRPEDMSGKPRDGFEQLYEGAGMIATEDGAMNVLAGSTFGGGTTVHVFGIETVNWSASLRPQHYLREQWASMHGLDYFLSSDFADSVEYVCNKMGVSAEHLKHNKPNSLMVDASLKLGYPCATIPQNTGGTAHPCGTCGFGCVYGEKQSGPVCWLKSAAQDGAKFMVETTVERLLFASTRNSPPPTVSNLNDFYPSATRRHCIGALVKDAKGQTAVIRAKQAVVVSAGSINSPAVLMRSGLKNPRIGRNLRLHPTTYVTGFFDEDINPWDGAIMTAVSTVHENWDGTHHGVKIEVIQSFPGGRAASFQPWAGSTEHKKALVQFGKSSTLIAICRDRGSGRIFLDEQNKPRFDYVLDAYDAQGLLRGIVAMAEMHLVAGANRILTTQSLVEDYIPAPGHKGLSDPAWKAWIAKVQKAGVKPTLCGVGSAHQMGSNQMGTKPTNSVVDPRARVWGTHSLYVADASIFPTASAVNPMITNLSLSHSVSRFIDEDLREKLALPINARL
ncbi:BZ3500_MvSof-1268-A1-R1_Chr2-1g04130 [Microbotryum saponariae]|uniref:Long-chain-alcohol oxidase n=1 Tax=Microbotryum saponariae TaxID=289078 RepID=A0A2X0KF83_9BASI|nr:BZ3500_MvSof-1268-A1-R1_Chr2-1g04130 [Microbotryum saponariae]SCZ91117.1 BZ3501_MvSof-1269-A2-R1_Chr2-1g03786 [Microbotryum saponariae]